MSFSKPISVKQAICLAALLTLTGTCHAHSWVEEMQVISDNGSYTGDYGYTRGYVARTDPTFTGESMKYILPPASSGRSRIDSSDLLCHPSQRTSASYSSPAYPRLQVSPGSYVAMKYLENGHVTLPATQPGKPKSGGPVYIYSTRTPSDTEKLTDVLAWNAAGSSGDKRGRLVAANNYDDGRCHQLNSGPISTQRQVSSPDRVADQPTSSVEQWCETDFRIPADAAVGETLTLYWVWAWPTEAGVDPGVPEGKDEWYTSCAEVEVVKAPRKEVTHTLVQQDPQTEAVSDFKSRTAIAGSPSAVAGSGRVGSASASASASASSAPAPSSAPASIPAVSSPPSSYTPMSSATPLPAHSSSSDTPFQQSIALGHGHLPWITYSLSYLPSFVTSTMAPVASASASTSASVSAPATPLSIKPSSNGIQNGNAAGNTVTQTVTDYVTLGVSTTVSVSGFASASASGFSYSPTTQSQAGIHGARFRHIRRHR